MKRLTAVLLVALAPSVARAQFTGPRTPRGLAPRVPHATTDQTHGHRFSIEVRRVRRIAGAALPGACDVAAGFDAVIVHVALHNLEARAFHGIVEHFVLAWERNGTLDGGDAEDVTCPVADRISSYSGELDPPIPPHAHRVARLFFAVPAGARLVRLDYHDDDAPTRFALPR